MVKRLIIIAFLTGIGHLATLLSLKFISEYVDNETIARIGEIDTLLLLIVSVVAFGLQLSTARDLALLEDWKQEYYSSQSARLTLSIFLSAFGLTGFFLTKNYLFFISPIIALNADYALYGVGKPMAGAIIALIRILIPTITLIICSVFYSDKLELLFSLSLLLAYFFTGIIISRILNVNYFVKPQLKILVKYYNSINIGLADFASFFVGIGIINIMAFLYTSESIAPIYIALKLYMIFKGVRRIIVQSFFKELLNPLTALKVDYYAIVSGIYFLTVILYYPNVIITILFDEKFITYVSTFLLLGISGFISSITTSTGTRLLLKNQDKSYSRNLITAALVTIVSGVIFWLFFKDYPILIAASVLMGELTISILNTHSLNEKNYLRNRLKLLMPLILISFLFLAFKYIFGQNIGSLIISIIIFGIICLLIQKNIKKWVLI